MHQTAEQLARMPLADAAKCVSNMTASAAEVAWRSWQFWRLAAQAEPEGDWGVWLVMAGRGFGKTRMGAEWVRERAEADGKLRIALVGATLTEARNVMVEGESGLLASAANGVPVVWEPSLKKVTWANGAVAHIYSAAEPESLRGPQHHLAWADEIAKWPYGIDAWDNLMFGLRIGARPQIVATTTPRPVPLVRRLLRDKAVQRTVGRTIDNAANLPESYPLRGGDIQQFEHLLRRSGFVRRKAGWRRGDVLVLRPGPAQVHLGLWTGESLIHADAGLGRIVETPGIPCWPVLSAWLRRGRSS